MRNLISSVFVTGILLAACGDDTSTTGGGSTGGQSEGGRAQGGEAQGGTAQGGQAQGGQAQGGMAQGGQAQGGMAQGGDGGAGGGTVAQCGNGALESGEVCDDGNTANMDGCSSTCTIESGWDCTGEPSACSTTCGDGVIGAGGEGCDDGNTASGDGCADDCTVESGWSCMNEPSVCMTGCGDGIIAGTETCDDMNMTDGDGCSAACAIENGYDCNGMPSVCVLSGTCMTPIQVTGNGFTWQAANLLSFGDNLDLAGTGCVGNDGLMGAHPEAVFQVDLLAGQSLHVAESGAADVLMHVLTGACDSMTACDASFDGIGMTEVTPGLVYQAPADETVYVVVDSWEAPAMTDNIDLLFEIFDCGDGAIDGAEVCDDGNAMAGDGCSAICRPEPGYQCTGEPSTCAMVPGIDCSSPIVASDGFVFTGSNIATYGDDLDYTDASCLNVSGTPNASPDIVFQIDLTAGQRLHVYDLGTLDTVVQVTQGSCGAMACLASADDPDATGVTFTAPATDTYYVVYESYFSNPSAASTFDIHFDVQACGDGTVDPSEGCDDGNGGAGDGCSATCTVEPGFSCAGSPSVCTPLPTNEILCNDGLDNNGQNGTDGADPTCATPAYFPACGAGQNLVVLPSGAINLAIPDNNITGVTSQLTLAGVPGNIVKAAIVYNITHTFDADLDISLTPPSAAALDVCSDNGFGGDNFVATVLDSTCVTAVTAGAAPFTGCFTPETSFAGLVGSSPNGTWSLKVADDTGVDVGTLNNWSLVLCTQ